MKADTDIKIDSYQVAKFAADKATELGYPCKPKDLMNKWLLETLTERFGDTPETENLKKEVRAIVNSKMLPIQKNSRAGGKR